MNALQKVFSTVKSSSPILYWIVIFHFLVSIACILGMFVDDRTLMGVNVWVKPFKFGISTGIYILSVGFLITLYPFSTRKKNIINNIVSWTLLIETFIVLVQAARGVQSHYNQSTPVDGILFGLMGLFIGINVLIMILFIIESVRLRMKVSKSIQLSIFFGWVIVLLGSWIGGQMIGQLAHNVGVADGGAGLPILNWSTVAGDLRVGHFFGMHGLQVIPIFGYLLHQKWKTTNLNQIVVVCIFTLLYTLWIGHTFYQAKQGMAFIAVG